MIATESRRESVRLILKAPKATAASGIGMVNQIGERFARFNPNPLGSYKLTINQAKTNREMVNPAIHPTPATRAVSLVNRHISRILL
jgi:hypothetical protein